MSQAGHCVSNSVRQRVRPAQCIGQLGDPPNLFVGQILLGHNVQQRAVISLRNKLLALKIVSPPHDRRTNYIKLLVVCRPSLLGLIASSDSWSGIS